MHEQLENLIAQWRRALAQSIGNDPKILDELESHLRDEVDRQTKAGLASEPAFQAAAAKIGAPDTLAPEFAKLARPWWPIRAVAVGVCCGIACLFIFVGVRVARNFEAPSAWLVIHIASITVGYLLTYGIGVLALCYGCRRMMRELALGQQTSLVRALAVMGGLAFSFTLIGLVTGCVWSSDHLGRFFDYWDVRETGALIVLTWQAVLVGSAVRSQRSLRWLMCWGVLGNLAVTYAWFIAAVLSDIYNYDPTQSFFIKTGLFLTPCLIAIMASGLLPSGWLRRVLVHALTGAVERLQQE